MERRRRIGETKDVRNTLDEKERVLCLVKRVAVDITQLTLNVACASQGKTVGKGARGVVERRGALRENPDMRIVVSR